MFDDRVDAGRQLARELLELRGDSPVVLGLPRGGVPVAFEVARALQAPLDLVFVRKLGVPGQPELAAGAIGEDGVLVVNREVLAGTRLTLDDLRGLEQREREVLEGRVRALRPVRRRLPLFGRTAIIVDDGLATGATARAACQVVRAHGARRVVLAVPAAPSRQAAELRREVDELVCLEQPYPFWAVGQVYRDFGQVDDAEVLELLRRAAPADAREVEIPVPGAGGPLPGLLDMPVRPRGLVAVAHGSGSSRFSPRNHQVARRLQEEGLGTLLLDLLTETEVAGTEVADRSTEPGVAVLGHRLLGACDWLRRQPGCRGLPLGLFGASSGAAAALVAAATPGSEVDAVVSRGGRTDLAGDVLPRVLAPTLLVVGEHDQAVAAINRRDAGLLRHARLVVVPGASHLFEEPGTLDRVADLACAWFVSHLVPERGPEKGPQAGPDGDPERVPGEAGPHEGASEGRASVGTTS